MGIFAQPPKKGESIQIWGLCRLGLRCLLNREGRIPAAEYRPECMVERLDPRLSQARGGAFRPWPLRLLAEPLAHHLGHGRFRHAGADPFPLAVARASVGHAPRLLLESGKGRA